MRSPISFLSSFSIALLALLSSAQAVDVLYTDSVSYCSQQQAVILDNVDIKYWRANNSLTFDFQLAAVEGGLDTSINIYVNAYGMQLINDTINLCDILGGYLCPLPQINFTGHGTYPAPSSFQKDIPGIAYSVPDLEAYARVSVLRNTNNEVVACVQSLLANGHTSKHKGVAIATGIFTLVALLVGLFHSVINSPSPAQYRWFDILYLFQTAVATGLLNINYPLVYTKFTQNFAWSFGLFHSTKMQDSITKMRLDTGGADHGGVYNPLQYIPKSLSPYNLKSVELNTIQTQQQFIQLLKDSPKASINNLVARAAEYPTITSQTPKINKGFPVYTEMLEIPPRNALTTIFFFFLAFVGMAIVFHALLFIVVLLVDKHRSGGSSGYWATRLRRSWWGFCGGNALRVCLVWFLPLWIFGFYQFWLGGSGLAIFWGVFGILITLVPLAVVCGLSIRRARRHSSTAPDISPLYTSFRWFHSAGMIYRPYRPKYHYFWFILVLAMIARAGFIAFGPDNAWAQVIGNMVVELLVLIALIAFRPHKDRKGDWLAPFLSFLRLVAFGLLIAFIPSLNVDAITRTIIGLVEFVIFGVPTVLLFLGLFFNAGYGYLWRRHTHRIEDGLEVERFSASDDDSATRAAMTDAYDNHFASRPNTYPSRASSGHGPSLDRRQSVMEPISTTYPSSSRRSSRYSQSRTPTYNNRY